MLVRNTRDQLQASCNVKSIILLDSWILRLTELQIPLLNRLQWSCQAACKLWYCCDAGAPSGDGKVLHVLLCGCIGFLNIYKTALQENNRKVYVILHFVEAMQASALPTNDACKAVLFTFAQKVAAMDDCLCTVTAFQH